MVVSQSTHVAQVYQTTMAVFVILLGLLEIVAFCLGLSQKIANSVLDNFKDEIKWEKQKNQSKTYQQQQVQQESKGEQQNDLQKSVTNYVQNQITNMQKTEENQMKKQQQQDQKPPQIQPVELMAQNQRPLSQNRQKFLRFYVAFNSFISQNMSILMPLLIIGLLTQSTYVFSLAAFFCAIFCSIIFDFLRVEQQLKSEYKRGFVIRRLVKILSSLIILSIFLSYWVLSQYSG